jgi:signal transduction histidine kinase
VAEGRASGLRSIHYGNAEGLPSLQANFGGAPGAFRSRDGRIWIPMRTALAVVNPNRVRETTNPPPVVLHRVAVDDRTAAFYSGVLPMPTAADSEILNLKQPRSMLRLPPGHRRVQFEFAALSLAEPENLHFRYRLEPYDDRWVDARAQREIRYSRLSPGKYQLHITAGYSDQVWNKDGVTFNFVVLPFTWQTWWFRTVAVAAFTGLIIAIVRYVSFRRLRFKLRRLEQQEALHKERARIAKDIHDDVGANLTQIALLGDLARQDGSSDSRSGVRLDTISRTARQAVKSLDEIVWAVNPRNDTLAHLIDYTGQFAVDYLRSAGIRCRLDLPDQTPPREISTDVRHNLFLVVKEALNNVVKHAGATEVWVRIKTHETALEIAVEDDGRGFNGEPSDPGADGLRNMRQRSLDIGGSCRIESHPGRGTRIIVDLPWPMVPS